MNKKFMNVSQLLSNLGVGTRKECIKLIKTGQVKLSGHLLKDPNFHINTWEEQIFDVNGEIVPIEKEIYIALNKEKGYGNLNFFFTF